METELHVLYGAVGVIMGAVLLTYLTRGSNQSHEFEPERDKKKRNKKRPSLNQTNT
jgi:hypothetical protein